MNRYILIALVLLLGACGDGDDNDNQLVDATFATGSDLGQKNAKEETDPAVLYGTYCSLCHGNEGEGFTADGANALNNPLWLAVASDEFIFNGIARGRPGTSMSGWALSRGGPLSDNQINILVALIRSWQTSENVEVDDNTYEGVAERAQPLYEVVCESCHGENGEGVPYMSLNNAEFLANASDGYIHYSIAKGRAPTVMPAYETQLTAQNIADLVLLIRSWQTPVNNEPIDLTKRNLDNPVINPGGSEPDLGAELLVSVDVVKAELDKGAEMVILDARPIGDFVEQHIKGAVSVPFYAVEDNLQHLPSDKWIVAYCACPHAESTQAAKNLQKNGYTKVRVLDEGFNVWKEKGYPVSE